MRSARLLLPIVAVLGLAAAPAASAATKSRKSSSPATTAAGGGASSPTTTVAGGGASSPTATVPSSGASLPTSAVPSGGAGLGAPATPVSTVAHPMIQGASARIIHGAAYAPSYAPPAVQRAIWAGNQIRRKPYIYAGGHGTWNDAGYDCSGTVSYVLHAAGLLNQSMDSGEFMSWAAPGLGQWITVYTNPGHAFIEIAGIRLDTSAEGDANPAPGTGPRWRPLLTDTQGFVRRHPLGL